MTGKDGKQSLQEAFDVGFEAVKGYIDRSFDAIEERILAIEARIERDSKAADKRKRKAMRRMAEKGNDD